MTYLVFTGDCGRLSSKAKKIGESSDLDAAKNVARSKIGTTGASIEDADGRLVFVVDGPFSPMFLGAS